MKPMTVTVRVVMFVYVPVRAKTLDDALAEKLTWNDILNAAKTELIDGSFRIVGANDDWGSTEA